MSSKWEGKQLRRKDLSAYIAAPPGLDRRPPTTIDVTAGLRNLVLEDSFHARSERFLHPDSSAAAEDDAKLGQDGPRNVAPPRPRRPSMRKTATAPPGSLSLSFTPPHPPRRAISARLAAVIQDGQIRYRRGEPGHMLPRLSQLGTSVSRSLISRRKSSKQRKPRHKKAAWRPIPAKAQRQYETIAQVLESRTGGSLSAKPRVRETLMHKNIRMLNTEITDFQKKELPGTPTSISKTPRELYGEVTAKDRPQLVKPLGLRPLVLQQEHLARQLKRLGIRRQQVYLPGPIRLSVLSTAAYRKDSTATLESFAGAVAGSTQTRRASDDAALDEVVSFFEDLGVLHSVAPDELDRYWEPAKPAPVRHVPVKAMTTPLLNKEAAPRPTTPLSSTLPSHNAHSGQRGKLKRLIGLTT